MIGILAPRAWARIGVGTCVAVLVLLAASPGAATECGPWTWVNPLPQGNHLEAVAAGDGVTVAGGEGGTLLVSTDDGVTWHLVDLGIDEDVRDVTWTGSEFLGVSVRHILSSPDGLSWTVTDPTPAFDAYQIPWKQLGIELQCIASDGQTALVGATQGTQLHRDAAGDWQLDYAFERFSFTRVAVRGTTWVALARSGNFSYLFSSTDSSPWTTRYAAGVTLNDLATSGTRFVAVGTAPSATEPVPLVVDSSDGSKWTARTPASLAGTVPTTVTWNGGLWALASQDGRAATASDPAAWTVRDTGSTDGLLQLAWTGTALVAVGERGALLTSPDAISWTSRRAGPTDWLYGAAAWPGGVLATARFGAVLTSADGLSWQRRETGASSTLTGAVWTGSRLVAVGYEGTILTSLDGVAWTPATTPTTASLLGVAAGSGRLVAVGSSGTVIWSDDGLSWTAATSGTTQLLNDVVHGDAAWAAVGNAGTILTSPDGVAWTVQASGTAEALYAVGSDGQRYVVAGSSGKLLTSTDGVGWESVGSLLQDAFQAVLWDGRRFLASTLGGKIHASADGLTWSVERSRAARPLRALATRGETVLALGEGGAVLRQDCGRQARARRLARH